MRRVHLPHFREQISIKDVLGIAVGTAILSLGIQAVLVPAYTYGRSSWFSRFSTFLPCGHITVVFRDKHTDIYCRISLYKPALYYLQCLGVVSKPVLQGFKNIDFGIDNLCLPPYLVGY